MGIAKEDLFRDPPLIDTRGRRFKVAKPRGVSRLRRNRFAVRVVTGWNSLPQDVVDAPSLNACKNRLGNCWAKFMYQIPE